MAYLQTVEALNERIKELSCLYDISTLATEHPVDLAEALQAIAERVAVAWRYSEDAIAVIHLGEDKYYSRLITEPTVKLTKPVVIDKQQLGTVHVHYPASRFSESDFLPEERQLLKKVAQEIAGIVERHQRIQKEEILRRSAERNDRLSILGEITAGIAHELNTPLGNILGFSELIAEKANEEQLRKDAQKITSSAMHAREVVKKLMFFSCEMPQQMESIALNPLVKDALNLLKPSLQSAGVNVHFEPDPKNPFGRLDPIQITQVIFNMLINAIHASPAGSTISIKLLSADKKLNIIIAIRATVFRKVHMTKSLNPFLSPRI